MILFRYAVQSEEKTDHGVVEVASVGDVPALGLCTLPVESLLGSFDALALVSHTADW